MLPFNVEKANCYGISEPVYQMAFGDSRDVEEPYDDEDAKKFAEVFCNTCDVKQLCLEYALDGDERFGVWGGKTPKQRIEVNRRLNEYL